MASDSRHPRTATRDVTAREAEILTFLVRRFGNAEIAEVLSLSKRTVESHVSSLYRKFAVDTRGDLIRAAIAAGTVGRARLAQVDGRPASPATRGLPDSVAASRQARVTAARLRSQAMSRRRSALHEVRAAHRVVTKSWALVNETADLRAAQDNSRRTDR